MIYIIFVVSLVVLLIGSDWFIDSAEKIGLSVGISPFIVGVTIVAFGTSLPELATSIASVMEDSSEIVIGNVVGSNIANILLVLGMTAFIAKEIKLDFDIMNVDVPLLIISSILLFWCVSDFKFTIFEAILLLLSLAIFLYNSMKGTESTDEDHRPTVTWKNYVMLVIGGACVYFGATYTIYAINDISLSLGISPDIIALTVIALGTSLPEVVVSISAARKGKHAIAIGNVLGSNMFNTYAVMGIPRFFGDLTIPGDIMAFTMPFMVCVTLLFFFIVLSKRIGQWEGAMLLILYIFYINQITGLIK